MQAQGGPAGAPPGSIPSHLHSFLQSASIKLRLGQQLTPSERAVWNQYGRLLPGAGGPAGPAPGVAPPAQQQQTNPAMTAFHQAMMQQRQAYQQQLQQQRQQQAQPQPQAPPQDGEADNREGGEQDDVSKGGGSGARKG